MRYIEANWNGFEIDSSEFAVSLQPVDVVKTIKTFSSSSFIEKSDEKYISSMSKFYEIMEITKFDKPDFLEQEIEGEKIDDFVNRIKEDESSYRQRLANSDVIKLAEVFKKIKEQLPHLIHDLIPCTVTFIRKNDDPDGTNQYTISLSGEPYTYWINWYNQDEFFAVLNSIKKKCGIGWSSHL